MKSVFQGFLFITLMALLFNGTATGGEAFIKMSTTTSTENSGLLDILLPPFTRETGIQVKVLAKGTGAAIRDGMDGNVDIIFVHAREREDRFLADGYGAYRLSVMHNDFVIVGPASDPAQIRGEVTGTEALRKIGRSGSRFVSRGDDSGTHIREKMLWKRTGLPLKEERRDIIKKERRHTLTVAYPDGLGGAYLSIGQGMGKTLTYAEQKQAYTLSDRGTYLKYKYGRKGGLDLEILVEGDPELYNPYGVIPVSPQKHPHVKFHLADRFARWLVSAEAQSLIGRYRIAGHQPFFPDAWPGEK